MKAFFDTSVLVAAFHTHNPQNDRSIALFSSQKKSTAVTSAHCLAEFYAVTTRMPGNFRACSHEARLFPADTLDRFSIMTLDGPEYVEVLDAAVENGIAGGAIYDALIARCALKARAQILYTWNTRHFQRLGAEIAVRVREPGVA